MSIKRVQLLHWVYLFLCTGALIPMLINGPDDLRDINEDRSQLLNIILLFVNLSYVFFHFFSRPISKKGLKLLLLPLAISCYAFLSLLWSESPIRSGVIGFFLIVQVIAILFIAKDMSIEEFFEGTAYICIIATAISLVFILVIPAYGTMNVIHPGAWQGVFVHKNVLGRFAVFSFITLLVYFSWKRNGISFIGLLLSIILTIGSTSATAIIGLVLGGMLYVLLRLRSKLLVLIVAVSILIAGTAFWVSISDDVASYFDKSATLSGRTTLWDLSVSSINERPLSGFGMGAFWSSIQAELIRDETNWFVPHAHNGFLEIGLQLGYPGMAMFIALLLLALYRATAYYLRSESPLRIWPLLYMFFALLYGIGEANYLRPNSFIQNYIYMILLLPWMKSQFGIKISSRESRDQRYG